MFRFSGAVEGSSVNTVNRALGPVLSPASVMDCVWMELTEPEFVSVIKVSMELPAKRVRAADMESTAIRVRSPCPPDDMKVPPGSLWFSASLCRMCM